MKTKICGKCKKEKPINEFYEIVKGKGKYRSYCKECNKKAVRKHYQEHKEEKKEYFKEYYRNNPIKYWVSFTRSTHKQRGLKVLFTSKELYEIAKNIKNCSICDKPLDWKYGKGKIQDNSPTLDRKENEKTLTLDNVWIVCSKCNRIKNNLTMKEFIKYSEMICKKFKSML